MPIQGKPSPMLRVEVVSDFSFRVIDREICPSKQSFSMLID